MDLLAMCPRTSLSSLHHNGSGSPLDPPGGLPDIKVYKPLCPVCSGKWPCLLLWAASCTSLVAPGLGNLSEASSKSGESRISPHPHPPSETAHLSPLPHPCHSCYCKKILKRDSNQRLWGKLVAATVAVGGKRGHVSACWSCFPDTLWSTRVLLLSSFPCFLLCLSRATHLPHRMPTSWMPTLPGQGQILTKKWKVLGNTHSKEY